MSSFYVLCGSLLVCSSSDCAFSSAESGLLFLSLVLGSFVSSVLGSTSDGVLVAWSSL
jgi:hypothetical protein